MESKRAVGGGGFTLTEVLVSVAILLTLAGITYAGLAPVRDRARAAHCVSNLRQVYQAIQMYREDQHGGDPPGALSSAELGLPPSYDALSTYARDPRVFRCESEYLGPDMGVKESVYFKDPDNIQVELIRQPLMEVPESAPQEG